MRRKGKNSLIGVMVCSFFILFVMNTASFAQQENKVDPKLLDELIGGYEFKIQGQAGVFVFIAEEGKLMGAPAGEKPSVLEPVEGEKMTFVGYNPDGTEYLFKFLRNEEGKVAKCILNVPATGLLADMFKIEKRILTPLFGAEGRLPFTAVCRRQSFPSLRKDYPISNMTESFEAKEATMTSPKKWKSFWIAGNCFGDTLQFQLDNSKLSGSVSHKYFDMFPDDPEMGRVLRMHHQLTYEKLKSYNFDPNAEILFALEILK